MKLFIIMLVAATLTHSQWGFDRHQGPFQTIPSFQCDHVTLDPATA